MLQKCINRLRRQLVGKFIWMRIVRVNHEL